MLLLFLLFAAVVEGTEITPYIVLQVGSSVCVVIDGVYYLESLPQDSDCKRYISNDDECIRCRSF
jgi:hypothetical protein